MVEVHLQVLVFHFIFGFLLKFDHVVPGLIVFLELEIELSPSVVEFAAELFIREEALSALVF